jgi:hypothetical protein
MNIVELAKEHLLHEKYNGDGDVIEGDYYEFDSEELQKKIHDYLFWRDQLPLLKREIEEILGKSMDEAATPAKSGRGRRKGSPSVSDEEVEQKVIDILAGSATLGVAAAGIKDKICAEFTDVILTDRSKNSIIVNVKKQWFTALNLRLKSLKFKLVHKTSVKSGYTCTYVLDESITK